MRAPVRSSSARSLVKIVTSSTRGCENSENWLRRSICASLCSATASIGNQAEVLDAVSDFVRRSAHEAIR